MGTLKATLPPMPSVYRDFQAKNSVYYISGQPRTCRPPDPLPVLPLHPHPYISITALSVLFFTEGWAAPECKRTSPLGRALVFPRIQCTKHLLHHQHHQHYLTRHGQDFPVLHHSSRSCRPRWKDRSQHTSPTATDTLESGPNEPKMYTRLGTALWRKEVF